MVGLRLLAASALLAAAQLAPARAVLATQNGQAEILQQMGAWGQRMAAIQQPAIAAYRRCEPLLQRIVAAIRRPASDRAREAGQLTAGLRTCLDELRTAAEQASRDMAAMTPLPPRVEALLNVDSRDLVRRSSEAIGGMVVQLETAKEALEAEANGRADLAERKWRETRVLAGSALDAQILLLRTLRAGFPLDTNKAEADIRIHINRAPRQVVTIREDMANPLAIASLRGIGVDQRQAAERLASSWRAERPLMVAALARMEATERRRIAAEADQMVENLIRLGQETAQDLEGIQGTMGAPEYFDLVRRLSSADIRYVQIAAQGTAALSQSH